MTENRDWRDAPSIGQWLKQRRHDLDLTQAELASLACCSHSTVRKLEAGTLRPSKETAEILAAALRVPEEEKSAFVSWARHIPEEERDRREYQGSASQSETSITHHASRITQPKIRTLLPAPLTMLVGREAERHTLRQQLVEHGARLLTLTGPPGTGKTRLALDVAWAVQTTFPNGVYFVDLAPITEAELVAPAIWRALGLLEEPGENPLQRLITHLHNKVVLLVLDNFEQVVAAAPRVAALLEAVPTVSVVATSREALKLRGEKVYPLLPLPIPEEGLDSPLESLAQVASVQLFVQRAQDAQYTFTLTEANAGEVAQICRRLEGLPLAIELAAARMPFLTLGALLASLERRLPTLKGGARDLPQRHKTLHNAIASSYALLRPGEKRLLRTLAPFVGGCEENAVAAVLNATRSVASMRQPRSVPKSPHQVLDQLEGLRAKSLLRQQDAGAGKGVRFSMLETIREFAWVRLRKCGEERVVRDAHCRYYLALATEADSKLRGPDTKEWLARLDLEQTNLRAALDWAISNSESESGNSAGQECDARSDCLPGDLLSSLPYSEAALRMVSALGRYWNLYGYWGEGRRWLIKALQRTGDLYPHLQARALTASGVLTCRLGSYDEAADYFRKAITLCRELGDTHTLADALFETGTLEIMRDNYGAAKKVLEESLVLCRNEGNEGGAAYALTMLGNTQHVTGEDEAAAALLTEAEVLFLKVGDPWGLIRTRHGLGQVASHRGDHNTAKEIHQVNIAMNEDLGNIGGAISSRTQLARTLLAQGEYERARVLIEENLSRYKELGARNETAIAIFTLAVVFLHLREHRRAAELCRESLLMLKDGGALYDIASALVVLGGVALAEQDMDAAARLVGAGDALFRKLGADMDPFIRQVRDKVLSNAKDDSGGANFAHALVDGESSNLKQILEFALFGSLMGE